MIKHSLINLKDYVKKFCGDSPVGFKEVDIANDPNFIFVNDPRFNSVQLFDVEGNSVFVNSFLECQHYVKGGWDYIPFQRHESDYHLFLLYFSLSVILLTYIFVRKSVKKY